MKKTTKMPGVSHWPQNKEAQAIPKAEAEQGAAGTVF
jgi:hypothetical protein